MLGAGLIIKYKLVNKMNTGPALKELRVQWGYRHTNTYFKIVASEGRKQGATAENNSGNYLTGW